VDARAVADIALELGAGRRTKTDGIDPSVGVVVRAKRGDRVEAGDVLAEIHAAAREQGERAAERLRRDAYTLVDDPPPRTESWPEVIESPIIEGCEHC
jgi:pyrimidine-nucleoside phosphorylase